MTSIREVEGSVVKDEAKERGGRFRYDITRYTKHLRSQHGTKWHIQWPAIQQDKIYPKVAYTMACNIKWVRFIPKWNIQWLATR